ncbi:hypothetical protein [Paenibacillus sedimenti]|uniref:Uncharacterized protein n=1 Tax=Paenibacillus sedimenti TaxID=2770274 RepID=A0A926KNV2_9BACL|nr:hypothetical protein [Paenibacillus sedimenti]MBD0379658.1 hypothetical protein [Paenibacillus sedimenti]
MNKKAFYLFLVGWALLASHNFDSLILYGFDPFPLAEMVPYALIAAFWFRMKPWLTPILVLLFALLELNHTIKNHMPRLFEEGLGRTTFTGLFYDLGATVWFLLSLYLLFMLLKNKSLSRSAGKESSV